jgi:hypothetical protein
MPTLRSSVSAWPFSSKAMTTTAAPKLRHLARVREERLLAFLERDGIHHALALDALEAGLDHRPLRRVDHHRHARDVRLGGDEVQEAHHGGFRIQHALVHVHVDDLRAVVHLLARDRQRRRVVVGLDELAELGRARDVGALADVHEGNFAVRLKASRPESFHARHRASSAAHRLAPHAIGNCADVLGRRAAAAAHQVQVAVVRQFAEHLAVSPALRRIRRRHWAGRRSDTRPRSYPRAATALRRTAAAACTPSAQLSEW